MLLDDLVDHASLDFGATSRSLLDVCLNEDGFALGGEHIGYLDNLFAPPLDPGVRKSLSVAYVYFAASFFCQDRVFDGDSRSKVDTIAPTVLEGAASGRILGVFLQLGLSQVVALDLINDLRLTFFSSMYAEMDWIRQHGNSDCRLHFTGRSELFLFGFRLVSEIKGRSVVDGEISCLRTFIEAMQHGDDIGDWREDHLSGKVTPTLRYAYEEIGSVPDEAALEEFVYLSGFYEKRCGLVSSMLCDVRERLRELYGSGGESMIAYVDMQIAKLKQVSERFVDRKSSLLKFHGLNFEKN